MIEQTRFLSTEFLCSEFKLQKIYSGILWGKNVCCNFYLRELIFCRSLKKSEELKLEPTKISCHTIGEVHHS